MGVPAWKKELHKTKKIQKTKVTGHGDIKSNKQKEEKLHTVNHVPAVATHRPRSQPPLARHTPVAGALRLIALAAASNEKTKNMAT